jgi:PhzF family phenazine biosynthesis protein
MPPRGAVAGIRVFVDGPGGGNPVPLVADATGMTAQQMQDVARRHGHESAFVLAATDAGADWRIRFFVPQHEMEMCGHATVGTLWALRRWGVWTAPRARIETLSGIVEAQWDAARAQVWISQPAVQTDALGAAQRQRVADALGLAATPPVMTNAATSRVKTLVALRDAAALDALAPRFEAIEALCEAIGSTGLYPFALERGPNGVPEVYARQFPKSSGYPEDAATGIAAAALWGHLASTGQIAVGSPAEPAVCVIRQGRAMGSPSAIELRPRFDTEGRNRGCWLSGRVEFVDLYKVGR